MTPERWTKIQDLFHQAVELPREEWAPFLARVCPDATLSAEVLAMVEQDAKGASFLDRGVGDAAEKVIGRASSVPPVHDVGPYHVEKLLGEGGMGVVHRAHRADLGNVVAIKFLKDAWLSPARRDRFAREQRVLAQLKHPGIAQLHDAGATPTGVPYFVMELVDGIPITTYCGERRTSVADRLLLFRQACEAVQYAHGHLVIHRDIKPSNVLVTNEGQVKLLDFGISKRIDARLPRDATAEGFRLMTPAYAAPEQWRGGEPAVDTDVYSLGLVLYEMLSGGPAFNFDGKTPSEASAMVLEHGPPPPSAQAMAAAAMAGRASPAATQRLWADLDVLVMKAIHRDRTRRYATVEALIRDIDHLLRNEPLEARADDWRYRAGKFAVRNRRWLSVAVVTVVTVASVVAFYTVKLKTARDAALAEVQRTQRIEKFMFKLFDGGDRQAGPNKELRAIALVERGAKEAASLSEDPQVLADLNAALGGIFLRMGDLPRAADLTGAALEQRRRLFGDDGLPVAASLVELADVRRAQAAFEEAESMARQGLEKARKHGGGAEVDQATMILGRVLEERGRYGAAIDVLNELVRSQAARVPESEEFAESLRELSHAHFYAGHHADSRRLMERLLVLDRKRYGDAHPAVSSDLIDLGAIELERANYPEAERLYRQGLSITEAWYGRDDIHFADDLIMLVRALVLLDREAEALPFAEQALRIRERTYGTSHPSVARVVNELGGVALGLGRHDDALAYYDRALVIQRSAHPEGLHYQVALGLANRGSVHLARKDGVSAERDLSEALEIYRKTLSPTHSYVGVSRIKLGRALLLQGRYAEALAETKAGHDILTPQMNPTASWIKKAREDLIKEYEALHRSADAEKMRAEMSSAK